MAVTRVPVPTAVGFLALPLHFEILPRAARTVAPDVMEIQVEGATGLAVVVNAQSKTATPSVTVTIQGVMTDGTTYDILAGAAITDVTSAPVRLQVSPEVSTDANKCANALLPEKVRISVAHSDTDCLEYVIEGTLTP